MVDGWNLLAGSLLKKLREVSHLTPDLVAELIRQMLKEAMILTALPVPTTTTTRCGSPTETKARLAISPASPSASAAR